MVPPWGPLAARSGVHVDPLVVVGRLREPIDPLLVDDQPVGWAQLGALGGTELR